MLVLYLHNDISNNYRLGKLLLLEVEIIIIIIIGEVGDWELLTELLQEDRERKQQREETVPLQSLLVLVSNLNLVLFMKRMMTRMSLIVDGMMTMDLLMMTRMMTKTMEMDLAVEEEEDHQEDKEEEQQQQQQLQTMLVLVGYDDVEEDNQVWMRLSREQCKDRSVYSVL
jgi:hypothetical protein